MIAIPNIEKPKGCLDCPVNDMACELWTEVANIKENRHPACSLIEIDQEDEKAVLFLLRMRKAMREGKSWREFLDEERRADE